jgi:serralysin
LATYHRNSLSVTDFDPVETGHGKYLAFGTKWGGDLGSGLIISFSFPSRSSSKFANNYSSYNELGGWSALTSTEIVAVRSALNTWTKSSNITFKETADSVSIVGELRFTKTSIMEWGAAHAYYPWRNPSAGDVWFNTKYFNTAKGNVSKGSYDYFTILHEIGHALGLKHPFEGPNFLPSSLDNYLYTIMSYTASPWSKENDNYATFYPTTPMYYDLLTIQAIYGKKLSANAGNTVYTFNDGTRYWEAINDSAGIDTITYNGAEGSTINLNPGQFSQVSERIYFSDGRSTRGTVTVGPGVVIENAIGGKGNDTLIGNGAANFLNGGVGRDLMRGGAGNDTYCVDNVGDVVDESVSDGIDTVRSYIPFSLANSRAAKGVFENLTLLGTASLSGTGTSFANVITGNSGNNTLTAYAGDDALNGAAGRDLMRGGGGNDIYYVDNVGDIVDESASYPNDVDRVQSFISFSLANTNAVKGAVENLALITTANLWGAGNSLNNIITGNSGNNILAGNAGHDAINGGNGNDVVNGGIGNDKLYGGLGNDRLTGGVGHDAFYFATPIDPNTNFDTITDFSALDDAIYLEDAIFSKIGIRGIINAEHLQIGPTAKDEDDRIIYNPVNGVLSYDGDGVGVAQAVKFAVVGTGSALSNAHFWVV